MNNKRAVVSGFTWMFGERIVAQAINLLISIILARILLPDDYGIIAIVSVFIEIFNVFISNGFGSALIQKKDADQLDFSTIFYTSIIFCLMLFSLIFMIAPCLAKLYDNQLIMHVLRVMALRIPVAGVYTVQQAYVFKTLKFKKTFLSTLIGSLISAVIGIYMANAGYGVWALVSQHLVYSILSMLVLSIISGWHPQARFSICRLRHMLPFSLRILLSSVIDETYNQLRSFVIGYKYSAVDLAYYNKGVQFPSLVVTNVNTTINNVLFPVLSGEQDSIIRVKEITQKAIKICSYLMFPLLIGLLIVAEPFILLILTEKWESSIIYLQIMCIAYMLTPINSANLQAIKAIGRADIVLKLEIAKKIVGALAILFSMRYGVLAVAWSMVIVSIITSFINAFPNKKLLNYGYVEQIYDIVPNLIPSVIMGFVVYVIGKAIEPSFIKLFVQAAVGVIIYLSLSLIFRNKAFYILINIIKSTISSKKNAY